MERYLLRAPLARRLLGQAPAVLAIAGVSVLGTHLLAVRSRTGGRTRIVVVNVLRHRGHRYLVSSRGTTQWVRNLRTAGRAELRLGKRTEPVLAVEVPVAERPALLRAYMRQWRLDGSSTLEGVGPAAPDAELIRIAPAYPVFRIEADGPITTSSQ
ncbi:MAG TPA: nitroreductase/quinone reductase family protein [Candidatus Dormibacteraeota bacterium]|jgi:deazaflavin-dependent oxidoreductase (nitroreductase family)